MNIKFAAKLSLSFLWIFTGITSLFLAKDIGYTVLAKANITGHIADTCIILGSVIDILIGLWLLTSYQLKHCYLIQLFVTLLYTLLLSIIDPSFWLHPFGPLTKNLPILVMVYYLYKTENIDAVD